MLKGLIEGQKYKEENLQNQTPKQLRNISKNIYNNTLNVSGLNVPTKKVKITITLRNKTYKVCGLKNPFQT